MTGGIAYQMASLLAVEAAVGPCSSIRSTRANRVGGASMVPACLTIYLQPTGRGAVARDGGPNGCGLALRKGRAAGHR